MTRSGTLAAAVLALAALASAPASAQFSLSKPSLKSAAPSVNSDALVSELTSGSFDLGGAENAAGTLSYCQKQGYTSGGVSAVRNKLLSKLGGLGTIAQSAGYVSGAAGVLQAGDGASFDLTALKGTIGRKVCSAIAEQATSSFLRG